MIKINNSFFGLFEFDQLMHEAVDQHLVYTGITILRSVPKYGLKTGAWYQACWYSFEENKISFINWVPNPERENSNIPDPETLVEIAGEHLMPLLVWSRVMKGHENCERCGGLGVFGALGEEELCTENIND